MGATGEATAPSVSWRESSLVSLDTKTAVEPLLDGWVAWSMLLDPIARGFYQRHHRAMLASYLRSPDRHAAAVSDPRLAGGPFCDLAHLPLDEVVNWAADHAERTEDDARFVTALTEAASSGAPIGYDTLPQPLTGRVELMTDPAGRSLVRPLRGTRPRPTEVDVAVWADGQDRPSMFGTPRLPGDRRFTHGHGTWSEVAAVAELHHRPATVEDAAARCARIGVDPDEVLVPAEPAGRPRPARPHLLGHAAVAVPLEVGWVVCDPIPPTSTEEARRLGDVRIVLVTHCHPDHLNVEALLALLPQQPAVFVPPGGGGTLDPPPAPMLRALGFSSVTELWPFDTAASCAARITALPFLGEHGSLPIMAKTTYLVETAGRSLLLAADSTGAAPETLRTECGAPVDVLVVGMEPAGAEARWLYGPVLAASAPGARERMAGATASEVMAMARASRARAVAVYGRGAPGMDHVFGRAAGNPEQVDEEIARLTDLARAAGLPLDARGHPGLALRWEGP